MFVCIGYLAYYSPGVSFSPYILLIPLHKIMFFGKKKYKFIRVWMKKKKEKNKTTQK